MGDSCLKAPSASNLKHRPKPRSSPTRFRLPWILAIWAVTPPANSEVTLGCSATVQGRLGALHDSPHDIAVCGPGNPVLRIYSDASFEEGILRVGWICFPPHMCLLGGQQIFLGQTLAGLLVPWFHPRELQNFDIVWHIGNEAAANCLIRGNSREHDVTS